MSLVLSAAIMLVDLFVAITQVIVSAVVMRLEVSAAFMQVKVSASNMWGQFFLKLCTWESVAIMQVIFSAAHDAHDYFYCNYAGDWFFCSYL